MHKSLEKFTPYIEKKLIRKVVSPCKKLVLFNYTDACTYERAWDEVTLGARGTVYEIATGKVVAQAFPKFFNFGELDQNKQQALLTETDFEVYEKMDGSHGIVYFYDGEWRVNTRGSFTSDQAIKGKEILEEKYDNALLYENATFLMEIIYPENRIIVDYGKEEKLVLLGIVDTESGEEYSFDYDHKLNGQFPITPSYNFDTINKLQEHLETLDYNEEGYVVRFSNGYRVKFKSAEYLRLARIISNMSPLAFWEKMVYGKVDRAFLEQLPEEFRVESEKIMDQLEKKYEGLLLRIAEDYYDVMVALDATRETEDIRKKVGMYLKQSKVEHSSAIFPALLGSEEAIDKYILKQIRPTANIL